MVSSEIKPHLLWFILCQSSLLLTNVLCLFLKCKSLFIRQTFHFLLSSALHTDISSNRLLLNTVWLQRRFRVQMWEMLSRSVFPWFGFRFISFVEHRSHQRPNQKNAAGSRIRTKICVHIRESGSSFQIWFIETKVSFLGVLNYFGNRFWISSCFHDGRNAAVGFKHCLCLSVIHLNIKMGKNVKVFFFNPPESALKWSISYKWPQFDKLFSSPSHHNFIAPSLTKPFVAMWAKRIWFQGCCDMTLSGLIVWRGKCCFCTKSRCLFFMSGLYTLVILPNEAQQTRVGAQTTQRPAESHLQPWILDPSSLFR